jgi:hypothetical protein
MSVPTDKLMELMRGPRSASAPAPMPQEMPNESEAPPISSPMSTPEPKMGSKEAAMINLGMAMDLLEQSLPALGSETEEGQKAIECHPYTDQHPWSTRKTKPTNFSSLKSCRCYKHYLKRAVLRQRAKQCQQHQFLVCLQQVVCLPPSWRYARFTLLPQCKDTSWIYLSQEVQLHHVRPNRQQPTKWRCHQHT